MCNAWNHPVNCTCGFGGEGHLGGQSSPVFVEISDKLRSILQDWEQKICRKTRCPECKEPVFFVRHNGGSVWLDDLGPPWPKHACFDNSTGKATSVFPKWMREALQSLPESMIGLVVNAAVSTKDIMDVLVIRCANGQLVTAGVTPINELVSMLGELVVISSKEKRLIHPRLKPLVVEFYEAPPPLTKLPERLLPRNKPTETVKRAQRVRWHELTLFRPDRRTERYRVESMPEGFAVFRETHKKLLPYLDHGEFTLVLSDLEGDIKRNETFSRKSS